jgi:hypothetical protein
MSLTSQNLSTSASQSLPTHDNHPVQENPQSQTQQLTAYPVVSTTDQMKKTPSEQIYHQEQANNNSIQPPEFSPNLLTASGSGSGPRIKAKNHNGSP